MKITIVYHSGYGHTQALAEAVARGARAADGADAVLMPVDAADWERLKASDAIVFGTPTYMGSPSAAFKGFMEASSKAWMAREWEDKLAAGFTVSGSQSGDKLNTLQDLSVFAAQHGMLWVGLHLLPGNNSSKGSVEDLNRLGFALGAGAQANADQGVEGVTGADRRTAEALGRRVAEAAARWGTREKTPV
jgi:multimeric flavodoxin WrbA